MDCVSRTNTDLRFFLFMGTALRRVQLTYIRRGPRTVCRPSARRAFKVLLARNKNAEGFPESNGLAMPGAGLEPLS